MTRDEIAKLNDEEKIDKIVELQNEIIKLKNRIETYEDNKLKDRAKLEIVSGIIENLNCY